VVDKRTATPPKTSSRRLLLSVLGGVAVLLPIAGCGEGSGVEKGATVSVYAGAAVCPRAKRELGRAGAEAGAVRVRVVCIEPVETGGRLDLAAAGANARRAVEDSSAVAYLEAPGRAVGFIRPILDEAEIRLLVESSGAEGLATVLDALRSRGTGESPRESVWAYSKFARASSMSVKRNE
jgi:hypothetical protein